MNQHRATSKASAVAPALPAKGHDKSSSPTDERGKWMALAAALLGWLFDGAEMGIFSMVGRSAVTDLLQERLQKLPEAARETEIGLWFGVIIAGFLVGAATGGVVFGWLGDRIGRVRAMTLSVLTYAVFTGLCGFADSAWQVGLLRFIAALGMGGEWSLGVALVMEVWPNRSRAYMAGLIGAAANVGYLLVGVIGLALAQWLQSAQQGMLAIGVPEGTAAMLVAHNGWRLMMLLGTLPALLTFFIRIFVPESEKWEQQQQAGATSHWATQDLLAVVVGVLGPGLIIYVWAFPDSPGLEHTPVVRIIATLLGLAIATAGYTFPVIRYFQRTSAGRTGAAAGGASAWLPTLRRMLLAAVLSGIPLLGTWGSTQWSPSFAAKTVEVENKKLVATAAAAGETMVPPSRNPKEWTLIWISVGAVVGTLLAAALGNWIGRRPAYVLLCVLSLISVYGFYLGQHPFGPRFLFFAFLLGACTASFYGWLPLYLPELFRTNVRATGQGFGFNFGRILAAIGVLQTPNLMGLFTMDQTIAGITIPAGYPLACSTMSLIYLAGIALIWLAPETHGKPLPE